MTSPLEGSLARQIYSGMKGIFPKATLVRDVAVSGSPSAPDYDPNPPVATSYACRAIIESYSDGTMALGYASQSDRKLIILANSLSVVPVPNDRVTVSRHIWNGVKVPPQTVTVLGVVGDPALATWVCKARV